ncbi:MAG: response regulator [Planctomycetales bacterium]|nr:response regulator [Planctomycetales bacterium]
MTYEILLCDDEMHILRAAELKFKRSGFNVRLANDGREALERIQELRPDVVVTDYQMPRMNGLELIAALRSDPATRDLPIVLLTAKGFELSERKLIEEYGISKLLAKPFSPREMVAGVMQLLEKSCPASAT